MSASDRSEDRAGDGGAARRGREDQPDGHRARPGPLAASRTAAIQKLAERENAKAKAPLIHELESIDCPCKPLFFKACNECDGAVNGACWKCTAQTLPDGSVAPGGTVLPNGDVVWGLIPIDYFEAAEEDGPLFIIHRPT